MANQSTGKASSDSPALKPYRGKPAVRNFRGGNGNVGIIRSPVRHSPYLTLATIRVPMPENLLVKWRSDAGCGFNLSTVCLL